MSKQQPYTQNAHTEGLPAPAPLTNAAADRLRGLLNAAQADRRQVGKDRDDLDGRINVAIAERAALDTLALTLDETIKRYTKQLADHAPAQQQWTGPQTGVFQAPEYADDPDASLNRASQARDNIPVPAGKS